MLDKVENIFLTIVQFVLIAGAGILLTTSVIMALLPLQAIGFYKPTSEGGVPPCYRARNRGRTYLAARTSS